jgi:hypothetical protein
MRLRRSLGFVLFCAAAASLAALTGLSHSSGAATQTVTASITFVNPGVVGKTNISFPPQLPNSAAATVFMDSYGVTWAQYGDLLQGGQGLPGVITVADSGNQLINFLTGNPQFSAGLEPLGIICSMHATEINSCSRMLDPASGKVNTVFIAMNVMMNDRGRRRAKDGSFTVADASSSIDVTVVYQ